MITIVTHHKVVIFVNFNRSKIKYRHRILTVIYNFIVMVDSRMLFHVWIFHPKFSCKNYKILFIKVLFNPLITFIMVKIEIFIKDKKLIVRKCHTSFYKVLFCVTGISKNNDIASLWSISVHQAKAVTPRHNRSFQKREMRHRNTVCKFFGKKMISDKQRIFHRTAWNSKSLSHKKYNKKNYDYSSRPRVRKLISFM